MAERKFHLKIVTVSLMFILQSMVAPLLGIFVFFIIDAALPASISPRGYRSIYDTDSGPAFSIGMLGVSFVIQFFISVLQSVLIFLEKRFKFRIAVSVGFAFMVGTLLFIGDMFGQVPITYSFGIGATLFLIVALPSVLMLALSEWALKLPDPVE